MKWLFIILLFFITSKIFSQEIDGHWRGRMYSNTNSPDTFYIELELKTDAKKKIAGYSICYYDKTHFGKASIRGYYNFKRKTFFLNELKILESNKPDAMALILDNYVLQFNPGSNNKLIGAVRCNHSSNPALPCHEDLQIELER